MRLSRGAVLTAVVAMCAFPMLGAQRTFVSGSGSDSNPCTHDLPCRSFATAIAATNANGEVVAIDSAGYGAVTVTQSVTMVAPLGVHAGISVFTGDGVTVSAADSDVVVLRNLFINAQGGTTGINFNSAAALYIEHCVVSGFTGNDINLVPTTSDAIVMILDTIAREAGQSGIYADHGANAVLISVDRCSLLRNQYGFAMDRGYAVVRDCMLASNSAAGVFARGSGGEATMTIVDSTIADSVFSLGVGVLVDSGDVSLSNCTIHGNDYGVWTRDATASVRLSRNTITHNQMGVDNGGGVIGSTGDNMVNGNGSDKSGTITVVPTT